MWQELLLLLGLWRQGRNPLCRVPFPPSPFPGTRSLGCLLRGPSSDSAGPRGTGCSGWIRASSPCWHGFCRRDWKESHDTPKELVGCECFLDTSEGWLRAGGHWMLKQKGELVAGWWEKQKLPHHLPKHLWLQARRACSSQKQSPRVWLVRREKRQVCIHPPLVRGRS